ncbi:MAG TPA: DUF2127 domain-containing protein [Candidatus Dormibacteraeota bacterium]
MRNSTGVNWFKYGDLLDRTFAVGIILKGLDGVLEVLGGLLLLVLSPATIDQLTRVLTQHELSEDPHDFLATHLLLAAGSLTGSSVRFGAAYLISHGVVKIVLVTALLRNKLWAYPWMIAFLLAFIAYQVYRMTFAFSIGLLALTVFDVFVTWLTYLEYGKQRARRRPLVLEAR